MPILDLQRRYVEIGRIRMGVKNAKGGPARLDTWRLTSSSRSALDEAAALWGGQVREWKGAPTDGQHELITNTDQLPIIVQPGPEPVSQWYEEWNRGGCVKRCDGARDVISDSPCSCDPEARTCKVTTRISLMLPDLPGLGVWRLETHGYNAGAELPGTIEFIRSAAARGMFMNGVLRIEQRVKISGGQTKKFPVPVIDLDITVRQLAQGVVGAALPAPSDAQAQLTAGVTPVPREPAPPLSRQLESVNEPPPSRPRSNAAAPIPSTGIAPRTRAEVGDDQDPGREAGGPEPGGWGTASDADGQGTAASDGVDGAPSASGSESVVLINEAQRRRLIAIGTKEAGLEYDQIKAALKQAIGVDSTKDIPHARYDEAVAAVKAAGADAKVAASVQGQLGTASSAYGHEDAP